MFIQAERTPGITDVRPISPNDINISRHLYDAFDNTETEVSAHYIIGLCQQRGSWEPFTRQEIEAYYRSKGHEDGFTFNALIEPMTQRLFDGRAHTVGGGFIIQNGDTFTITPEFVERAYKSSPQGI